MNTETSRATNAPQRSPDDVVHLPPSDLRRILAFTVFGGLGLGIICYGLLRAVEMSSTRSVVWGVVNALLFGIVVGLAGFAAIRQALRLNAHELHRHAVDVTNTWLPEPPEDVGSDELAYMRNLFSQSIAAIPRPEAYPDLATDLVDATDIPHALTLTLGQLERHMRVVGGALLLFDQEHNQLFAAASRGVMALGTNFSLDAESTAIGRAMLEQRILLYSGAQSAGMLPILSGSETPALLCLPMISRQTPIGVFCIAYRATDLRLNDDQRLLANGAANLLTLTIQSLLNRQALSAEQDRLAAFERLADTFAKGDDHHQALSQVLNLAARITASAHGSLLLLDHDERQFRQRIALNDGNVSPLNIVAQPVLRHGLAGWAIRERRADIINNTEHDTRWLPVPGLTEMRSAMVVPLIYGERILGVLTLAHPFPHHFSERGKALVAGLGAYAANLIARYQLEAAQPSPQVTQLRRMFSGHVALPLLDELAKHEPSEFLTPHQREVTVIYASIGNLGQLPFTPEELLRHVIAPFNQAMSEVVFEHQGYLELRPDGALLAVVGFPLHLVNELEQGCRMALAMQSSARRLRTTWHSQLQREIHIGIGVARGPLMIGLAGSDANSDLTLIGAPVSEAQRLHALSRKDEIMLAETVSTMVPRGLFRIESLSPFVSPEDGQLVPIARLLSTA